MKKIACFLVFITTVWSTMSAGASAYSVAVFPIEISEGLPKTLGNDVAGMLAAGLSTPPNLIVLERMQVDDLLGEQGLSLTGAISQSSMIKTGSLLGAQVLVTGRAFKGGDGKVSYVARVIGTETGRVFGVTASGGEKDAESVAKDLAEKITSTVAKHGDTLVAKAESRGQWLARVGGSLKGKTLPTVSVKIPEEHVSQRIPDPAAETEIKLLLSELGFKVVNDQGQVDVAGEAFSEMGLRKASLVACRARVEIKITATAQPGQQWVDRETASGIDLSEQIAAKNALQTAGQRLAERIATRAVNVGQ